MNQKLKELALQIGGSHYPEVSELYLEKTVRMVIERCAEAYHQTRNANTTIEQHFLQEFDLEPVESNA
jgi:hypothetical protein